MKALGFWQNLVFRAGGVMVVAGAVLSITGGVIAFWLFAAGALCFSAMQMAARYEGRNLVVKRLRRQQLAGALFLLLSAAAMGMQVFRIGYFGHNEWVICLLVSCVYEVYTAFRIPAELEKEKSRG
ncbi:MAG: hypothetical protein K2N13_05550 [Paraprevotella sp.]|nr:hypothetical protein [Paraprevotella sp.]